jgi:hypothetical protein
MRDAATAQEKEDVIAIREKEMPPPPFVPCVVEGEKEGRCRLPCLRAPGPLRRRQLAAGEIRVRVRIS